MRPPGRDIAIFAASVVACSLVLSFLAQGLVINALFAVAPISVILSARGFSWERRLAFTAVTLGGFVVLERTFESIGFPELVQESSVHPMYTVLGAAYVIALLAYPTLLLLLFIGGNPSALWTSPSQDRAREGARNPKPPGKAGGHGRRKGARKKR